MSRTPALAFVTLIIAAATLPARAQTARVTGRVVADETNEPVPNARVAVTSGALGTPVVLTDGEGRFALTAATDRSAVVASKTGYARSEPTAAAGRPIEIRLRRAAAISGRVVDELGDPVPNAGIFAETVPRPASNPQADGIITTDDRGEYRLSGLPAGNFAVAIVRITLAALMGQDRRGPQKIYYPGTATLDDAQVLRVGVGEDRSGIDFVVEADRPILPPTVAARQQQLAADPSRPVPAAGTGVIRGQVSSTDGRAVPHARVMLLSADPLQSRAGVADERGLYEFRALAAGTFRIGAAKIGHVAVVAGELAPYLPNIVSPQRSVDLTDGVTREAIDLSLARLGAITGRVFDELGDPVEGAVVQLLQIRYTAGRRRLIATGAAPRPTDDLGGYRLFAVTPGHYVVSASVGAVQSIDIPGYARSYFPGTPNPGDAQFVSIATAQDAVGIDFTLARTRTARVAGTVLNAAGDPVNPGALTLVPSARSSSVVSVGVGARILSDGRFEFPNVPSGQYVIRADRGKWRSWTEGEFGTLPVAVDGSDVTNLVLQTSAGSTIKGRFRFDAYNGTKMPSPSAFELVPVPVDPEVAPSSPATRSAASGTDARGGGMDARRDSRVRRRRDRSSAPVRPGQSIARERRSRLCRSRYGVERHDPGRSRPAVGRVDRDCVRHRSRSLVFGFPVFPQGGNRTRGRVRHRGDARGQLLCRRSARAARRRRRCVAGP